MTEEKREKETELNLLLDCISNVFLIERGRIISGSRVKEVCYARHAFFKLARALTNKTIQHIGDFLNRHHATVIHNSRECENIAENDQLYRHKIDIVSELYIMCTTRKTTQLVNKMVADMNNNS
jgi:chromosomal replication initiation ATPase DnaA